jgi:hypothetical protein
MGNNQYNVQKTFISVSNELLFSSYSSIANSASQDIRTNQSMTVNVNSKFECGKKLSFIQSNQTYGKIDAVFASQTNTENANRINAVIETLSQSENTAFSGWLSTKVADSQGNYQTISQHLQNIVSTHIEEIIMNICTQNYSVIQSNTINIKYPVYADTCDFHQNIQLYLYLNCASDSITNIVNRDEILSSNIAKASALNDSEANGVFESLFGSFGDVGVILIIVAVFIVAAYLTYRSITTHHENNNNYNPSTPIYYSPPPPNQPQLLTPQTPAPTPTPTPSRRAPRTSSPASIEMEPL